MATRLSVKANQGEWVDLYAETGITPGTQIIIQNIGSTPCFLVDSATEPDIVTTGRNIIQPNNYLTSVTTPDGSWAYSELGTTLQVEEA